MFRGEDHDLFMNSGSQECGLVPQGTRADRGRAMSATMRPALVGLFMCGMVAGCTTPPAHRPVPPELYGESTLGQFDACRYGSRDGDQSRLKAVVAAALNSAPASATELSLLSISSGGERGAFAVGVLDGWTERGDRPQFQVVCGVSVGALIAPLAFVGPEMDGRMREAVAQARSEDTFRLRGLFAIFGSDSLAESEPLARSLEKLIDDSVIDAVARGHREGRRLFVVSTDLDAECAVVWDLGAIAASEHPDAPAMFRRAILASAAVPVAYPPQRFDVEAGGQHFDEMHVDGAVMSQVALPLPHSDHVRVDRRVGVWVIVNGKLEREPMEKQPRILSIAARSMHVAQLNQARTDTAAIGRDAYAAGFESRVASIPGAFDMSKGRGSGLDPEFVKELYALGRELARKGEAFRLIDSVNESGR